jgi:glycosyltransferase involved in cell wall biosynthesis
LRSIQRILTRTFPAFKFIVVDGSIDSDESVDVGHKNVIYFTTKAYNAAATLRRAIESVLTQTYSDFTYHLCDNGSTDETGDIIREYAKLDRRIVPFFNARNMKWTPESRRNALNLARYLNHDDWFCVLDADDDYAANFLEETLGFARAHSLDYAVCRSDFIDEASGQTKNEYVLLRDIIISGDGFGTLFPDYFRFMGARWGKLQKGSLLRRVDFAAMDEYLARLKLSRRSDTVTMLWYLRYSERAGVLAKSLHNYRQYPMSSSKKNIEDKIRDNYKMPDVYRDFLMAKVGFVSAENEKFIGEAFERSMRRTREEGKLK